MITVNVNASKNYDVIIGENILSILPEKLENLFGRTKVMIVTDSTVHSLHYEKIKNILDGAGFENDVFVFPAGEKSKSKEVLFDLLETLAEKHYTKADVLVAFGGGVTGDLTGLAAALFLRGIHIVQVPTTLLSAVDSSVGGKTAVNLKAGKNLAGVFNQPELVLCDVTLLETLTEEIFADGMAEVIKYGVLADSDLFAKVENGNVKNNITEIISRCVEIKRDVVSQDEFDKGLRQLLNFGHTLGHAIEAESNFEIHHGTAVAMGMVMASEIAYRNNLTKENTSERIEKACRANNLETVCPYNTKMLAEYVVSDKKISGKTISFIIPEKIGKCTGVKLGVEEFVEMLGEN
ncbi:MAG: 3-dehydroquinate synthase [Clostridia bacterium]|nr:3-dehydroquinate synthase [Clostridia bacterium]